MTRSARRQAFAEHCPGVDLIALVDYENDCVRTSLEVARALEGRLWGVRLDTSENLVDKSVIPQMGTFRPTGVNPQLVWNVRNALDAEGFGEVKIVVSGGLNAARVREFEDEKAPVDVYAVGTSIVHDGRFDFTGDIVMVDGQAAGESWTRADGESEAGPRALRACVERSGADRARSSFTYRTLCALRNALRATLNAQREWLVSDSTVQVRPR